MQAMLFAVVTQCVKNFREIMTLKFTINNDKLDVQVQHFRINSRTLILESFLQDF